MKLTKKRVLGVSVLVATILLTVNYFGNVLLCTKMGYLDGDVYSCLDVLSFIEIMFLSFLPLSVFSLITYKMRDDVFESWKNFSVWWIPLSVFLILITPESHGGGFGPQISFGKEDVSFILSALFFLISSGIVIIQWFKTRK